jgi:hypothetical protein
MFLYRRITEKTICCKLQEEHLSKVDLVAPPLYQDHICFAHRSVPRMSGLQPPQVFLAVVSGSNDSLIPVIVPILGAGLDFWKKLDETHFAKPL